MVRLTARLEDGTTVVTIDGRLESLDLDEVRRFRDSLSGSVVLELAGLDSCAEGGVRLLQDWVKAGARVDRATPFLRMLLDTRPSPAHGANSNPTVTRARHATHAATADRTPELPLTFEP